MKVFIAGASGVLGRRVTQQLVARGHSVVGLVHSAKGESVIRAAGGEARHADLFDADALANAADGCDTVIHAATSIPTKSKTIPADWAMNDRIRRKGTRCLTEAAAKIGAKAYLQQSIVWVARPQNDSSFDEDSPTLTNSPVQSAIDGETIAREAGSAEGFTVTVLRGGNFYGSDSAHTLILAEGLRSRSIPIIGAGEAVWAMIHNDDAASAFVSVAEQPRSGVWHVVDNELVTVRELLETFVSLLGAPRPKRVPTWLAKWTAGEKEIAFFTRSTRTSNARLRRDFGWSPRYPTYKEGLAQIVGAWNAETSSNAAAGKK